MRATSILGAVLFLLVAAGCRANPGWQARAEASRIGSPNTCEGCGTAPTVGRVMPGDALIGDLHGSCQCFYFEGVEYTLFDVGMVVDCGAGAMPTLTITDPEGKPVDLDACVSGTQLSAKGVVLRKTGTYKGSICKAPCAEDQHYKLSYDLRLAGLDDRKMFLTPCAQEKISFIATRGANCVVHVLPDHACGCVPKVVMVKGPDGMRALACENQIEGAQTPRVTLVRETGRTLRFSASKPGRYTVILASEEGTEGDAVAHVDVFPARSPGRNLFHDGRACDGTCPTPDTPTPTVQRTTASIAR
jgi:hypothetical protein